MEDFRPGEYGALHADAYDTIYGTGSPDAAVETIAGIVGDGRLLELAIGTGRIALPLARRGVPVSGIDASPEMVAELRAKPGGADIPVTIGDMADLPVEDPFDHAVLVFNTLFCLLTQEAQIRCFQNVAAKLPEGGTFLIEAFVPDLARFADGQAVRASRVERGAVTLDVSRHDPVRQRLDVQTVRIAADGVRLLPVPLRYAWPAEIDLMARLAGMRPEHRWGGWGRVPFTADSHGHVSLYRKPAGAARRP